jgi:hypothetical protein
MFMEILAGLFIWALLGGVYFIFKDNYDRINVLEYLLCLPMLTLLDIWYWLRMVW